MFRYLIYSSEKTQIATKIWSLRISHVHCRHYSCLYLYIQPHVSLSLQKSVCLLPNLASAIWDHPSTVLLQQKTVICHCWNKCFNATFWHLTFNVMKLLMLINNYKMVTFLICIQSISCFELYLWLYLMDEYFTNKDFVSNIFNFSM